MHTYKLASSLHALLSNFYCIKHDKHAERNGACIRIPTGINTSVRFFTWLFVQVEVSESVSVPVSGCILNAGTVESLCMKPYVTLPLEPSSASTAWTCRTNVPAGWFSRTDVLSRYCWHWGEWDSRRRGQVGRREDHNNVSVEKLKSILHSIESKQERVGGGMLFILQRQIKD